MTEEPLEIWTATAKDIDDVMELAMLGCKENGFIDGSPAKMLAEIYPACCRDNGLVGLIGIKGQKPQGAVVLRVGQMWYSDQNVLEEKAIFIHPDYRAAKGGRASKLCDFSKKVADTLGLPLIIGVLSNDRTKAKVKMYQRHFGEPSGAFFLYGASTGGHRVEA